MIGQSDVGKGKESITMNVLHHIQEVAHEIAIWTIEKFEFDPEILLEAEALMRAGAPLSLVKQKYGGYKGQSVINGNMLLNEGINELWTLGAGGGGTAFNNANSYLAVGDSSTAESASQTDLQAATNKLYKAMDATFPTYGTSQKITFRSTFASGDANYAWNEFSACNGSSGTGKNLNRKVSAQGTKTSGQSWQLTLDITLS